jgi:photosystem II protein PsbQ
MVMKSYRSVLRVILVMVTTLLVSCGSPTAVKPPTYTTAQLQQIQQLAASVTAMRDEMPNLEAKIQDRNWTDIGTYIHGPLGELRRDMSHITRELLPQDKKAASEAKKDLFQRLEKIDLAAAQNKYDAARQNYQAALQDFDEFLQAVPQPKNSGASS